MAEFRYRVDFAHENDNASNETIHHGKGTIEITTDRPIESQAQKDDVARAIGLELGKTKIAVMQIVPLETGEVFIDYGDVLSEESRRILEGAVDEVPDITSMGKK